MSEIVVQSIIFRWHSLDIAFVSVKYCMQSINVKKIAHSSISSTLIIPLTKLTIVLDVGPTELAPVTQKYTRKIPLLACVSHRPGPSMTTLINEKQYKL